MLNTMVLPEGDETPTVPVVSKPIHIRVARLVSTIFSPITISLPVIILIALYHNEPSALLFAAITLFFLSIGPMLYILIGVSLGKFTDVDVSVRSQRTGPFLFSIVSSSLGFIILLLNHAPKNLQTVMLTTILTGIIFMIVTFWWKISMHASSLSGAVTMLAVLYGRMVLPVYLLVVLVGWSRVVLKRHTIAQVTAGALVSIALTLAMLTLRGV